MSSPKGIAVVFEVLEAPEALGILHLFLKCILEGCFSVGYKFFCIFQITAFSNAGGGQHLIGSLEFTVVNHCGCLNTIGVTSNLPRLNVGSTLNGWLRMSEVVHLKSEICGTWKMFQIVQFLHFLCHQ